MPPANVDATIILLDVGRNTAVEDDNGKTFFQNARDCVARIVERKIMSRPKDLVCIILLGSKRSKNSLADQTDDFRHIEYLSTKMNENEEEVVALNPPAWDVLRKLPQKPTKYEADWFEGLIVAADAFKNGLYGTKVTNKKIVLMTNFGAPVHFGENLDKVVAGFQSEEFEVDVFGPNLEKEGTIDKEAREGILAFVEATNGVTTTLDDAMRYLLFHRPKAVKPMPWNVELSIGPNVKIPISAYGRIRDAKIIGTWQKAYKDPVTGAASTTDGVGVRKEFFRNEDNAPMDIGEIVSGYYYGQKVVPFSDTDKAMLYESGLRGLHIYGFTDAASIDWQCLSGDGVSYIFGRNGDAKAQKAILCLVRALQDTKLVGVARRVYNNGNAPTMFAIFPCVDNENFYCLSAVALIYRDDIKGLNFPATNLKRYKPSEEEVDSFKKLIDKMDLMTAYDGYDDQEAIPVLETVNPSIQYVLDCLAFRAVNPNEPLPPPREDILTPFKPPEKIEKASKEPLEQLFKLLALKPVEKKSKKPRPNTSVANDATTAIAADMQEIKTSTSSIILNAAMNDDDDTVTYVGTVDPVGDFHKLLQGGKSLQDLCEEMVTVIENLVYLNFDDDYTKAANAIRAFRDESLKGDPSNYNDWLKLFKTNLAERGKTNVLQIIQNSKLNFIIKEENEHSKISKEELEDNPIYEVNTVANLTELTVRSDIYDMFDEM